jgi:hypothetical protein
VGEPSEFVVTLRDGEGELTKCVGDMAGVITTEATMVELEDAKIDDGAGAGAGAGAGGGGAGAGAGAGVAGVVVVPVVVAAGAAPAMKCAYTATHAGKLSIGVKVFGQHVPGSPFEVQTTVEPPFDYGFTHLGKGVVASGEGNRRVTNGVQGHRFAVATPGISEGIVFWDVKIHQVGWTCMGVIANTAPAETSYSDGTSYGWGGPSQVYIGGAIVSAHGGWPSDKPWCTGDEMTLKLDCQARTLSMKHKRHGKVFTIEGLPAGKTWHIHANLNGGNDSLEILPPSEQF